MLVACTALDNNANVAGIADRAFLVDANTNPGDVEFLDDNFGDTLGQGFDKLKFGLPDEFLQTFRYRLVVHSVFNIVARGSFADIGGHVQVDHDRLAYASFPVPDADNAIDF